MKRYIHKKNILNYLKADERSNNLKIRKETNKTYVVKKKAKGNSKILLMRMMRLIENFLITKRYCLLLYYIKKRKQHEIQKKN